MIKLKHIYMRNVLLYMLYVLYKVVNNYIICFLTIFILIFYFLHEISVSIDLHVCFIVLFLIYYTFKEYIHFIPYFTNLFILQKLTLFKNFLLITMLPFYYFYYYFSII